MNKISQLESIDDVFLLSSSGETLFCDQNSIDSLKNGRFRHWHDIIAGLGKPVAAEFTFDKGHYYLRFTDAGYIIVAMKDNASLEQVKIACIRGQAKLADTNIRRRALLKMLGYVDDRLKPQIIKELVPIANGEVAEVLLHLLANEEQFHQEIQEKLLLFICQALGYCSAGAAVKPLQSFLQKYKNDDSSITDDIQQAALISIRQLELDMPIEDNNEQKATSQDEVETSSPIIQEDREGTPLPEDLRIKTLLDNDRKDEAVDLILQLIETTTRQKKFEKAEQLRELLIQTDPMLLPEIIRAAEIIEAEKNAAISEEHLATWKDLAETLADDEFASLYHTMVLRQYGKGEMIAKQGEFRPVLFFINSGTVQVYADSEGEKTLLKTLGPGETIGSETFFEASVWTINVKSLGAELSLLLREKMPVLRENYPVIESKLLDFHTRFQSADMLFKTTTASRRMFERRKISGRTAITLLDKGGQDTGVSIKGELFDISEGGVSLSLRISRKKNAMALLGKLIHVTIANGIKASSQAHTGTVVAVRGHHTIGNEYSIHVEFNKKLNGKEMQQLILANQKKREVSSIGGKRL